MGLTTYALKLYLPHNHIANKAVQAMEKVDVFHERFAIGKLCLAHPAWPLKSWKRCLVPSFHEAESGRHGGMS